MAYEIENYNAPSGRLLNENSDAVNMADLAQAEQGQYGGKYIATTDATTPATGYVFVEIYTLEETVVTLVGNITGITTVTVPADRSIKGRYTSITLGSGSVIAYNGV